MSAGHWSPYRFRVVPICRGAHRASGYRHLAASPFMRNRVQNHMGDGHAAFDKNQQKYPDLFGRAPQILS